MNNDTLPLISVIIPAYNHEKYIQQTIHSIINQSYSNLELIILNDGSTDATEEKINEMHAECERRFQRAFFLTQENRGSCETLNTLIQKARGAYIFLIASDDSAKPDAIKTLHDFLSCSQEYAAAVGDDEFIDESGRICFWNDYHTITYNQHNALYTSFGAFLKKWRADVDFNSDAFGSYLSLLKGNYIPNGYLIRAAIFEKTGLFRKDAPLEDHYLWLQISKYGKVRYIDRILYSYRSHSLNISKQRSKIAEMERRTLDTEAEIVAQSGEPWLSYYYENNRGKEIMALHTEIAALRSSLTYRIGDFILFPFKTLRFILRRVIKSFKQR